MLYNKLLDRTGDATYRMIYDLPTANGDTVTHIYSGNREQIEQAISIARVHNYRIRTIDIISEKAAQ